MPENERPDAVDDLRELALEATIGDLGIDADDREIPVISLDDFANRRDEITEQLWTAATEVGFFQLEDHGIDRRAIDEVFDAAKNFFALPEEAKAAVPWKRELNAEPASGAWPAARRGRRIAIQRGVLCPGQQADDHRKPIGFVRVTQRRRLPPAPDQRQLHCLARSSQRESSG